jgi:hypothetical protein
MLIGFSAIHVFPAVWTGKMPRKWPTKPLTREENPLSYRLSFGLFAAIGFIGVALLFWSALKQVTTVL